MPSPREFFPDFAGVLYSTISQKSGRAVGISQHLTGNLQRTLGTFPLYHHLISPHVLKSAKSAAIFPRVILEKFPSEGMTLENDSKEAAHFGEFRWGTR